MVDDQDLPGNCLREASSCSSIFFKKSFEESLAPTEETTWVLNEEATWVFETGLENWEVVVGAGRSQGLGFEL